MNGEQVVSIFLGFFFTIGICVLVGMWWSHKETMKYGRSPYIARRCDKCDRVLDGETEAAAAFNATIQQQTERA